MKAFFQKQVLNSYTFCYSNPRMGSYIHINTAEDV